jgi:4'-phosphopantetheinyl transferase
MIYIVCSKEKHLTSLDEQQKMSRQLLQAGLMKEHDIDPDTCEIIRNAWGKPLLKDRKDVHFNISHCRGGVALSIAGCQTGIDIEKARPFAMTTARKILSDDELRTVLDSDQPELDFFRFWTLKESYVKAVGTGVLFPLQNIRFTVGPDQQIQSNRKGCLFCLLENNLGYVAAVCYLHTSERMKEKVEYSLLP